MKRILAVLLGIIMLMVMTIGLSAPVSSSGVVVYRSMPAIAHPGNTINMTFTFTSPSNGFNSVGLTDTFPAGWGVSNINSAPQYDIYRVTGNVEMAWFGPYLQGEYFTATYQITIPQNARLGLYYFNRSLFEYYIEANGPYYGIVWGRGIIRVY